MAHDIDTEYLDTIINQCKCKVNGIITHLNKDGFTERGIVINGSHLSFEYLQEKAYVLDSLLDTIKFDILMKSGKFRQLPN